MKKPSHYILNNSEYDELQGVIHDLFYHVPEDEQENLNLRLERLDL